MRSREVILTATAKRDLLGIGRYTQLDWGKKQRDTYLRAIDSVFQLIHANPKLGLHRLEIKEGYYSLPHGEHVVFYVFDSEMITVLAIVHKAMDIDCCF